MPRSFSRDKSIIVELTAEDIDPSLRKLQDEWEDLLMHDELTVDIPPQIEFESETDKHQLMALWFDDGVLGWKIDYPSTDLELKCYRITKSRSFLGLYTLICFVHICIPFFESPSCPWNDVKEGRSVSMLGTDGGRYFSALAVNLVSLLCVIAYLFEIALRLFVNHGGASSRSLPFYKDSWTLFRLAASCLLLLDLLVFFGTGTPIRFARALVPFVYISRRNSMRQLMHGLLLSFSRAVNVLMLYLALLVIWSFVGFIVFRKVENEEDNRFLSLPISFLTCLHALTARSYNAFVANEYFVEHPTSGIFFVSLLIFGDLLCTNLVVAVGNRQYRIFATRIFNRQLRNRRQAFVAIHEFLSDQHGYITRKTWLSFCSCIQGKYTVNPRLANMLFSLESEMDSRMDSSRDTIEVVGLFRLCALLSARVAVDPHVAVGDSHLERQSMLKARDSMDDEEDEEDGMGSFWEHVGRGAMGVPQGRETSTSGEVFRTADGEKISLVHVAQAQGKSAAVGVGTNEKRMERLHIESSTPSNRNWLADINLRLLVVKSVEFSLSVRDLLPSYLQFMSTTDRIYPFEMFFRIVRVLLAIQLVFVSGFSVSMVWWQVGWVLEMLLWVEMGLLMFGWGMKKYLRRYGFGLDAVINVTTLCLMLSIGNRINSQYSAAYVALLVLQVMRFLRVFKYLRDSELFMSIFPLVLRMFFLLFSIIYFFSVFGHTRLCNAFNEENIDDNVDDDSKLWRDFRHILNFNTLLQTVYTLFQVSILGNWSIVMDAAAHTERVPSMLFFFVFRMCMAMAVIPLLFAFIMQAFIARRNQDAASKKGTPQEEKIYKPKRGIHDEGVYRYDRYHISTLPEDLDTVESRRKAIEAAVENFKRTDSSSRSQFTEAASPVVSSPVSSPLPAKGAKPARRSSIDMSSVAQSFQAIAEGSFFAEDLQQNIVSTASPTITSDSTLAPSPTKPTKNPSSDQISTRSVSSAKAVKVGEKSVSMMSFWSGGETALAPEALKDKSRVQLLSEMLEEALHQLALQKEACKDATERNKAAKVRIDMFQQQQQQQRDGSHHAGKP